MNPKRFSLVVTKAPFDSLNAYQAWQFCTAAISCGHSISRVFFYQSGVHNASSMQVKMGDELYMYGKWCSLASQHNIPLYVCISAASRRGVVDQHTSANALGFNVDSPFEVVGLTSLFESFASGDICVQL